MSFIYNEDGNLTKTIQDGIEIKRSYRDDESLRGIRFLDQNIIQQRREKCNRLDFIYHNKNKINFQYNPNHLLKRVYPNNTFESFEYDDVGNIDSISNCKNQIDYKRDKSQLITNKDNQTFVYDGARKLIMELVGNINTNEIDILKTNYNKNKRALQLSDHNIENASRKNILDIADETSNDAVNNFLFNENKTNNIDKSFLIESKQPANTRSYYYDAVGNVLNNNSTYNEFKQLTNDDSYIYTYDDKGNLKTKKSKKDNSKKIYTFNAQNQLLKVETKSKNNNFIKSFVFTYDALNRRVSKTHTSIDNNYSHYYLYDGLNIVAILNNNTKELISTITYDDKIDTPLSITTNNKTYFYSRDHQGNILHLTNENAEIVEEFTYDAYGKITSYHQSEVTLNPYCYTGREFDDVDLYYYRFRYYDPTTKRFLSLDPIGFESGDYNHYRYVFSSPVNYTDALGLKAGACDKIEKQLNNVVKKGIKRVGKTIAKAGAKQAAKMAAAVVPFIGWAVAAWAVYDTVTTLIDLKVELDDLLSEEAALSAALLACNKKKKAKKKVDSNKKSDKNGTSVKGTKIPKKKVKCFCQKKAQNGAKYDDYKKQLKNQQDGINNKTVDDYLKNKKAYTGKDPCNNYVETLEGKTKKRNPAIANEAKKKRLAKQSKKYTKQYDKNPKLSPSQAKHFGKLKAKRELSKQDALHNADLYVGGDDAISPYNKGWGDSEVNRHIGTQWKGDRVKEIDKQACTAKAEGKGTEKMNVELRPCRRKEAKKAGCK